MNKRMMLILMVLAVAVGTKAGRVGEQEARKKASAFMAGQATTRGELSFTRVYLPLQTKSATWSVTDAPIYIYNNDGGGYVIVSGDDCTADILGFSETGHIDANHLAVNMKAWLQGYVRQIECIPASAMPRRVATTRNGDTKADIATKLKTEWGQDRPYNLHTPALKVSWNKKDTTVNSATGCVATAMAMIMNHYQYPAELKKAIASYEGTCDVPVIDKETGKLDTVRNVRWKTESISAGTTIDWANITDKYNQNSSDVAKEAVSRLIQYCGAAVNMQYGLESSASSGDLLIGLKDVFGYDDVYLLNDFEFDDQEWIDVVYHEMSLAGPVMFGGQTPSTGGHQFILDGYKNKDGKGYFYVNWGWDGEDNGYMLLSVMDPGWIVNDDGEHEGFTEYQDLLCGLGPSGKGYTTVPSLTLYNDNLEFGVPFVEYSRTSKSANFAVKDYYVSFWNLRLPELTVVPAIGVYNRDNQLVSIIAISESKGKSFKWGEGAYLDSSGKTDLFPIGAGLGDGTYIVKAITSVPNADDWIPMLNAENLAVTMTVSGNKCSFKSGGTTAIRKVVAETGVESADNAWYSLSGARLDSKPTTKGVYIHQGRKVVVK